MRMAPSAESRPLNSNPNYLAAFTSASSSGEDEVYVPFFLSITIVWHAAKNTITFFNFS